MTALQSTQRRLTTVAAGATLGTLVVLAALGVTGVRALKRYEGATKVDVELIDLPATDVGMLATVDQVDRLTSVTVFVVAPASQGRVGGSIVSVPIAADTTLGTGTERISLADAYAANGPENFGATVESLLSLTLDQWEVASPPETAALLATVGDVEVNFPTPVVTEVNGTPVTLYVPGAATLSASGVADVLAAAVAGQPESGRRGNIEALWQGVADSVGSGVGAVEPEGEVDSMTALLGRLFAGKVQARGLATAPIDAANNPSGRDAVELDRADAVMVFGSIAPNSTSAPAVGLVYRIEAPKGYDDRVRFTIAAVLYFGGNVQSVFVSDSVDVESATVFELYDARFEERTEDSADLFGTVRFAAPTTRISGVDVVIRLGTEFLDGAVNVLPSTTPSTTVAG